MNKMDRKMETWIEKWRLKMNKMDRKIENS